MARIIGTPGESAATRGVLLLALPLAFALLVLLPLTINALEKSTASLGLYGAALLMLMMLILLAWRWRDVLEVTEAVREGTNFLKGAIGEVLVHQELAKLPNEFIVFHDFHPVDIGTGKPARWNVDHIVVGPTGVFVLDAKYYKNTRVQRSGMNKYSRHNVQQVQRNAIELKERLVRWSWKDLESLFVVPVVVYTQQGAELECLREGSVRTLPLRMLLQEISGHAEAHIDQEKAGRVARVLYAQVSTDLKSKFKDEFDAYGELSKAERYRQRAARLSRALETKQARVPDVCPRCGAALVRRTARRGARVGKHFLGCSNYPTCNYGFNLEE